MGLLSDPEAGLSKSANVLVKHHRPLGFLLCVVAYVWFCLLAHKYFNNGNNFSENALLPGLVRSEFIDDGLAGRYLHELQEEVKDNYATTDDMPVPWLLAKMTQLNLDVYTHNFTLNFPFGKGQKFHGENIYGILRAGRVASTEALVISAPYRPLSSYHKPTNAGIALMLAMAKFARSRKYWAKDLIFLVTAHEQLGAQAWLQAYHDSGGPSSAWLDAGQLKGRAGSIQAAINLEMSSLKFNYVEVKIEGLNGQLPNLDLVTLVHKMCIQAGVNHAYKSSYSWTPKLGHWKNYQISFRTLLSMISTQATGVPTGNHGLFHRYGIEALTLMSVGETGAIGRPAHALEATLRSLNNLLERFHQSYFFYLRTNTDRFLSISQYMPPLGILCGALFIRAFALWLTAQEEAINQRLKEQERKSQKKHKEDDKHQEIEPDDGVHEVIDDSSGEEDTSNHLGLFNVLIMLLLVHGIGYLVMSSPQLISEIGVEKFSLATEEAIFYGLCIISAVLTILLPPFLNGFLQISDGNKLKKDSTITLLAILVLLELGTMMLCVGMHNFSLGLCMAAVYTPLALLISSGYGMKSRFLLWVYKFLWFLLHPLMISLIVVYVFTGATFPEENTSVLMSRGLGSTQQAIMFSIVDGMIYGNWVFNVITSLLLPIWLLFWQVLHS